ncbi:MAG: ferrous iron transporter B [Anaerovoracaceae bacterium]
MSDYTIALAGNPNVGKSTVFNALTGLKQHTGNWPGKTVERAIGRYAHKGKFYNLVDLPGTYSLSGSSAEEEIAGEYIRNNKEDLIVVVADATCLERNLNLVLQILALTSRVVLCVNLLDEAKKKRIKIDLDKLSQELKIPVVGVVARIGKNLETLKDVIQTSCETSHTNVNSKDTDIFTESFAQSTIKRAQEVYHRCVTLEVKDYNYRDRKLDRILTSRTLGFPIMILMLAIIFWITLQGSNYPSEALAIFFNSLEVKLYDLAVAADFPYWIREPLIHGVFATIGWVVSVMLPPMAIFFPLFTLLEDSGYLPRVAFNMDRFFQKACAHGKQMLTMCMSFGCNVCGIVGCRIIDSPRERLIAILTNNFIPCNGRFPTLIAIITMFMTGVMISPWRGIASAAILTAVILIGILFSLLLSRILSKTMLKGIPSSFALELPPYRRPQIIKVIIRSIRDRTVFVLGRAVMVAAPSGLLIWILANNTVGNKSLLAYCTDFLDPFAQLFSMDGVILMAFILGFPANEIIFPIIIMTYLATGNLVDMETAQLRTLLIDNGWNMATAICTMLFSLMHFPCGTTCLTIKKETGSVKWTALAFIIPTATGLSLCFAITQFVNLFQ